jgi:hypothetical protein
MTVPMDYTYGNIDSAVTTQTNMGARMDSTREQIQQRFQTVIGATEGATKDQAVQLQNLWNQADTGRGTQLASFTTATGNAGIDMQQADLGASRMLEI